MVVGCVSGSVGWASGFRSDRGLMVYEFEPHIGLIAANAEPTLDPLSSSLSAPLLLMLLLSLCQKWINFIKIKKIKRNDGSFIISSYGSQANNLEIRKHVSILDSDSLKHSVYSETCTMGLKRDIEFISYNNAYSVLYNENILYSVI